VEGLGLAYYLRGEFQAAIRYLEKAMGIRAPDITVLNPGLLLPGDRA
jgi:hypothetical protein